MLQRQWEFYFPYKVMNWALLPSKKRFFCLFSGVNDMLTIKRLEKKKYLCVPFYLFLRWQKALSLLSIHIKLIFLYHDAFSFQKWHLMSAMTRINEVMCLLSSEPNLMSQFFLFAVFFDFLLRILALSISLLPPLLVTALFTLLNNDHTH